MDAGPERPSARRGLLAVSVLGASAGLLALAYVQGSTSRLQRVPAPAPPAPAAPPASEDTRFGLSEAKRRDVYQEILRAEDHAQVEADRRFPPPDPSASSDRWQRYSETREQFRRQADEEDKAAIAARHALTTEQLTAIAAEGLQQNWPRPPRRSLR